MAISAVGRRVVRGYVGVFGGFVGAAVVDMALGDAYPGGAATIACVVAGVVVSQTMPLRPVGPKTPRAGAPPAWFEARVTRPPAPSDAEARLWITPPSDPFPLPEGAAGSDG